MKHLNTFKLFESSSESLEEIEQYLEDIFQELIDLGFGCRVEIHKNLEDDHWFTVNINYNDEKFKYNLIKDYIESATDYMDSIGYTIGRTNEWIRRGWRDVDLIRLSMLDSEINEELYIIYEPK